MLYHGVVYTNAEWASQEKVWQSGIHGWVRLWKEGFHLVVEYGVCQTWNVTSW